MADEVGQRELRTDYPFEEGTTIDTQTQVGRISKLQFEESKVLSRTKVLL